MLFDLLRWRRSASSAAHKLGSFSAMVATCVIFCVVPNACCAESLRKARRAVTILLGDVKRLMSGLDSKRCSSGGRPLRQIEQKRIRETGQLSIIQNFVIIVKFYGEGSL